MFDVRNHGNFGHSLKPGTIEDINCHECKAEKAAGQEPNITKAGERFRRAGCTCPPDHSEAWHFAACPWSPW